MTRILLTVSVLILMVGASYAAQYGRPDSDVTKGTWDDPNGNNNNVLYDDVDEATADDNDYVQSASSPSRDSCEVGLSDVTDPASSSGHIVRYRYRKQESGGGQPSTVNLYVYLNQGTTQIASWTHSGIGADWTGAEQTLTSGQADAITDYADLRLAFVADQSGGARTGDGEISWAEFEVPDAAAPGRRRASLAE